MITFETNQFHNKYAHNFPYVEKEILQFTTILIEIKPVKIH